MFLLTMSDGSDADSVDCISPKDTGPCRAAFKKWFFNVATGQCELFIYGGCMGNKNNYDSIESCKQSCTG